MFSAKDIPSLSSLFSTYASVTASIMLARSMVYSIIPCPVREYAISAVSRFFMSRSSSDLTLVIDENTGITQNEVYNAAMVYLSTKIDATTKRIKISKTPKDKNLTLTLDENGTLFDFFDGVEIKWKLVHSQKEHNGTNHHPNMSPMSSVSSSSGGSCFEVSFLETHHIKILNSYIPFVIKQANSIGRKERILKMHTLVNGHPTMWDSVNMEHPMSFDTIAIEPELKRMIMEDLDRFVKRKELYRRVGKAWKRGYLLYGPPGTGKSSLVAAMANYLKFDIYDLQLGSGMRDSYLRRLLISTKNRSILVIEDIDCCVDLPDRPPSNVPAGMQDNPNSPLLTLSGLLNFIDGLWSSCGDERIIILTTNHKDKLDPALLRPGRMDLHIHMSYCTANAFKTMASNYLGISENEHKLCEEIEGLIETVQVTPAQLAEELLKSEDVGTVLEGLVKFLKRKRCSQADGVENGDENEIVEFHKRKRLDKEESNV